MNAVDDSGHVLAVIEISCDWIEKLNGEKSRVMAWGGGVREMK
jgi:hypothetical protein